MTFRLLVVCLAALSVAACHKAPVAKKDGGAVAAASAAFIAKNAKEPGVVTLPSGLQYKIISSGPATGPHPKNVDEVKVHYEGALVDGTVFDSSMERGSPEIFYVNEVVPGWTEALKLMRPGDYWMVYLPPKLGYDTQDKGTIPPNSALIFKVELLDIQPHAGA